MILDLGKPSNLIFGILSQLRGGGICQSQLFQTKITTIQKGDFVAIRRGFPSPNLKITKNDITNHIKITHHPKNGTFS